MKITLEKVISQIPDWQTLTTEQLLAKLNEKTQLYVDLRQYRLVDVAKVISDTNMNSFLEAVRATDHSWMIDEAAVGFQPGDEPINARLKAIDNVYAKVLAEHTRRYISLLELRQITSPSLQEISKTQFDMKLELEKQRMDDEATDRLYRHRENISRWDGNPLTKPEL